MRNFITKWCMKKVIYNNDDIYSEKVEGYFKALIKFNRVDENRFKISFVDKEGNDLFIINSNLFLGIGDTATLSEVEVQHKFDLTS